MGVEKDADLLSKRGLGGSVVEIQDESSVGCSARVYEVAANLGSLAARRHRADWLAWLDAVAGYTLLHCDAAAEISPKQLFERLLGSWMVRTPTRDLINREPSPSPEISRFSARARCLSPQSSGLDRNPHHFVEHRARRHSAV
jgi:hypothetical protein